MLLNLLFVLYHMNLHYISTLFILGYVYYVWEIWVICVSQIFLFKKKCNIKYYWKRDVGMYLSCVKISSYVNDNRITSVSYNIRLSPVHDARACYCGNALRTIIKLIYIESILNTEQCIFNEVNTWMHNASSAEYYTSQGK